MRPHEATVDNLCNTKLFELSTELNNNLVKGIEYDF